MPEQRSQAGATEREWARPAGTLAPADAWRDDTALVLAARHDPHTFTTLYERYLHPVHRYCYLRLGSCEAAEDATSEVFLKALAGLESHRGGVFAGRLFRIARNVVNDAWRRGARGGSPPISRDLRIELAGEISDPGAGTEAVTIAHIEIGECARRSAHSPTINAPRRKDIRHGRFSHPHWGTRVHAIGVHGRWLHGLDAADAAAPSRTARLGGCFARRRHPPGARMPRSRFRSPQRSRLLPSG